ncbi:hypothetical protein GCM10010399_43500 [Dactylosporangium fulvum]|uniref:Threonine dehydratase n=1 Tax=Dactylosporangium fulvum TaxID=53359 RepID=A0ABY5W7X9_9ACTN|nr:hypothetical protein [Dactylosporangium fulvum]UWP85982.1 hypothetical protein Dfulv_17695 [Dactylosporangium fulvum]
MTTAAGHEPLTGHDHQHSDTCGHAKVQHGDHFDFLHDGEAHHVHEGHYDRCGIEGHVQAENHPHTHGEGCGHEQIKHGDHVDYLHGMHRHAEHAGHYDEH